MIRNTQLIRRMGTKNNIRLLNQDRNSVITDTDPDLVPDPNPYYLIKIQKNFSKRVILYFKVKSGLWIRGSRRNIYGSTTLLLPNHKDRRRKLLYLKTWVPRPSRTTQTMLLSLFHFARVHHLGSTHSHNDSLDASHIGKDETEGRHANTVAANKSIKQQINQPVTWLFGVDPDPRIRTSH
jgi:hypothetical protein